MSKKKAIKWLIGIDEAGRGPLAGPVTVGLFAVPISNQLVFQKTFFPKNIRDSKKLSESAREKMFSQMVELKKEGQIYFSHAHTTASLIDRIGITAAIKKGINKVLDKIPIEPCECDIRLDGLLKAPAQYCHQTTIIKGDEKEFVIALASVVAKVSRDRLMKKLDQKYPAYGFGRHKGYGTKEHYLALKKKGPSSVHRQSFLRQLTK